MPSVRVEFAHITNQKSRCVAVLSSLKEDSIPKILAVAKNKLKLKKAPVSLSLDGTPITQPELFWNNVKDGSLVVVSNDPAVANNLSTEEVPNVPATPCTISIIESQGNFILHLKYQSTNLNQFPSETLREWAEHICRTDIRGDATATAETVSESLKVLDLEATDPSTPLQDHRNLFNPLELQILDLCFGESWQIIPETQKLKSTPTQKPSPEYIIAHTISDKDTFVHEWAHAVYYLRPQYRALCEKVLLEQANESLRTHVQKELRVWGYDDAVYLDEFQAYVVEGPVSVFGKKWAEELSALQKVLRDGVGEVPKY
ncbi:hypothetical protein BCR33DRAFT_712432 [Rhizoclosmatium globosum]|uniref:Uncharacterized protein n=1 Tax=Rhizoclosmatium globosum TaxID=329046 RepID=A0A1Y2CWD7_9FUNG|nr:hypothetical protein BCR33DRAFT_712432 [Rhizoclosmatium globosum]|eukprot:ORY51351.1 hypothetical protein BCR33DRAFT_712432 [Rhizoclosmatium globosum]